MNTPRAGLRPIYPRIGDEPGARAVDVEALDDDDELPFRPEVQDVADLLRARTKDEDSTELGEFTDATRPTADGVERLITRALAEVIARLGGLPEAPSPFTLEEPFWLAARTLVGLYAAMLVELSYFPEQVRTDRSAYPEYERLFNDGLEQLADAIRGRGPGGTNTYSVPIYTELTASGGRGGWDWWWPYGPGWNMTVEEAERHIPRNPQLRRFPPSTWAKSPAQRP
jgi:hypothetical protein